MSVDRHLKVIPLDPSASVLPQDRGEEIREAVLQAVTDLVIGRVPLNQRSPYFEQGRGLVVESGWGPAELVDAAEPGPQQDALLEQLGIEAH